MMRFIQQSLRRAAAICLAATLLCTAAQAAEAEKTRTDQRREDLDFLYQTVLVENHPDVFANTPEAEFQALKQDIESRLETESDTEFLLDLMRLTSLVGDSHTLLSVGNAGQFRCYPFSLVRRGEQWYLSAAAPEDEALLCREVTALAGKSIPEVIEAYGTLFSSDNPVRLQRQFRQSCNIADIYEYLGLVEAGAPLTVTMKGGRTLALEPMDLDAMNKLEAVRISDRIKGQPATAGTDANYASKPLTASTYYIEYNVCREAEDLPMEDFAAQVAKDLDAGTYSRVLLDLRSNGGGSDGVIWPLLSMLRERQYQGHDFQLVGLIGEATFSSALINAVEIQEMGGVLVGESAGGSVCHFGAVRSFSLPNSKARGQISSKYIDLNTLLDAGAGRGVEALEPDVAVSQTLEDTLAGKDTAVEWLLAHPEKLAPKDYPDAPLTRGRLIGLLYQAAGSPAVTIEEAPFADSLGSVEWYCPALVWAKGQGIARGMADGTFAAARPVTWREASVFLNRAGDLDFLPERTDLTGVPTRAQGAEMAKALAAALQQ